MAITIRITKCSIRFISLALRREINSNIPFNNFERETHSELL